MVTNFGLLYPLNMENLYPNYKKWHNINKYTYIYVPKINIDNFITTK